MLIVALILRNERKSRDVAGAEIPEQTVRAFEVDYVAQTAFLNIAEIDKGIVLGGVLLDYTLLLLWHYRGGSKDVAEESVAVVNLVRASRRQVFLIALPCESSGNQLVGDGLGDRILGSRDRHMTIDIVYSSRTAGFVGEIDGGCCGIRAGSVDRTNRGKRSHVKHWRAQCKLSGAATVVPIRIVIVQNAEV